HGGLFSIVYLKSPGFGSGSIQLRLVGDKRKHYEGRLEVFYDNEWGTICDDDFSIEAAHVACRELGFLGAVA
ncbi:hypothetical protein M9458_021737, partial [Cirrhinus mrigala]